LESSFNMDCVYDTIQGGLLKEELEDVINELRIAVEEAPGARDIVKILKIYDLRDESSQQKQQLAVDDLVKEAQNPDFPKPRWHEEGLGEDPVKSALYKKDRSEALWMLRQLSQPEKGRVRRVRCYHGCRSEKEARSIRDSGLAPNIAGTKGWFGDAAIYGTTMATYALRYAFRQNRQFVEHWDAPPGTHGYLIATSAIFSQVYPVTRADYSADPYKCDLKGERLKFGCDAHWVRVRRVPPYAYGNQTIATYHSIYPGEWPQGTELVITQKAHVAPEFAIEVKIEDTDAANRAQAEAKLAAENWGGQAFSHASPSLPMPEIEQEAEDDASPRGSVAQPAPEPDLDEATKMTQDQGGGGPESTDPALAEPVDVQRHQEESLSQEAIPAEIVTSEQPSVLTIAANQASTSLNEFAEAAPEEQGASPASLALRGADASPLLQQSPLSGVDTTPRVGQEYPAGLGARVRLFETLQTLLGRPATRNDVVDRHDDFGNQMFRATVTLLCLQQQSDSDELSFIGEQCLGKSRALNSACLLALQHVEQQLCNQGPAERSVSTNTLAVSGSSTESAVQIAVNQTLTSQADISELNQWAQSTYREPLVWEMEQDNSSFRAATQLGGRRFQGDWVQGENAAKGKSAAKASCLQRARAEMR